MARYALRVKKSDLGLITALNEGGTPQVENDKKSWFVFEVDDKGNITFTDIVSERTLCRQYDFLSGCPFLIRVKEA